jgi:hypothetical protein
MSAKFHHSTFLQFRSDWAAPAAISGSGDNLIGLLK